MKYTLTIILLFAVQLIWSQTRPFPQHVNYKEHIKPNNYTQTQLDDHVKSFYQQWKSAYLFNDCEDNEYYIKYRSDANTVSEAHGYGMLIFAYMAGYDEEAKEIFDSMYAYYRLHPSQVNQYLMDWQQVTCDDPPSSSDGSATDGDIDIAFALLLADVQWGSDGEVNYLEAAKHMIDAIMEEEINQEAWTVKLGDWSAPSNQIYYNGTRSSDFIIDHFRAFACAHRDSRWTKVVNRCYELIDAIQKNYSPETGLLPDFIVDAHSSPKPAFDDFLEGPFDGAYYYNACRDPWRLGTDYLTSGDLRAKEALKKINNWLRTSTGDQVNQLSNGYQLDGTKVYGWNDATYVAPFAVGAMVDHNNQEWLNSLYQSILTNDHIDRGDYYSHTIKLLCMLVLSGNYWLPTCSYVLQEPAERTGGPILFPNPASNHINIAWNKSANVQATSVSILSLDGKTIEQFNLFKHETTVHIDHLQRGVYIIKIDTDHQPAWTSRLIKN